MDQFLIFAQFLHQVIWKSAFHPLKLSPPCFFKNDVPPPGGKFPKNRSPPDPRGGEHTMEVWPKIGKYHQRGSFNNPRVMALWLTRKLQHCYELHQNSAQMIS